MKKNILNGKSKWTYALLSMLFSFSSHSELTLNTQKTSSDLFTADDIINEIIYFEKENFLTVSPHLPTRGSRHKKKPWTFVIYMAADNNLRNFAARNIKQLTEIGSNQYVNILVQLDIKISGNIKVTRRYYIEKDQVMHVNANDPLTQSMDSGDPETLISCCKWAFGNYPSDDKALILWNHGTGCLDPLRGRIFNPLDLFQYNPTTHKLEIDRAIGFMDRIDGQTIQRGLCWSDTTGNYLTNQKFEYALKTIYESVLEKQKLSLIGFDACLMMMTEVADLVRPYADILCGSAEVEWAPGWEYSRVLAPFTKQTVTKQELAQNIVAAYAQYYSPITNDFTQSAVDLSALEPLEKTIDQIALLLCEALKSQVGNTVKKALWLSHNKNYCTSFDEPSFKDLHHLLTNLHNNMTLFQLTNREQERVLKSELRILIEEAKRHLEKAVLFNKVGKNLGKAKGLSIYFPDRTIHPSYALTNFAKTNAWYTFLQEYLTTA